MALLHSLASFYTTFLKIVVEVKTSGPPHAFNLWLVLGNGRLPVKHFHSNKSYFLCHFYLFKIIGLTTLIVIWPVSASVDITGFETVVTAYDQCGAALQIFTNVELLLVVALWKS